MPTRRELEKAAKSTPIETILGAQVTKGLTAKQKRFARKVAEGATKADAYREAYKPDASRHTLTNKPYMLMRDERIQKEVEAYTLAIEAERQRTPAALRSLVVHQLTRHALDQDVPPAVRISALRLLGQITEVAAFTERKEVRTISSSEDARRQVMQEIQRLMGANADTVEDAKVIGEADELLRELAGPHPPGSPPVAEPESQPDTHTIPHESSLPEAKAIAANSDTEKVITHGSEIFSDKVNTPPPQSGETPR